MKILITVNTYEPRRDGVQFVTKYLAEGLVKKGHEVHLLTSYSRDRENTRKDIINGVYVYRWDIWTSHTIHHGDKEKYVKYILENKDNYACLINVGTQTPYADWLFPVIDQVKIPKILYIHSIWDFKYHKVDFASFVSFAKKTWANMRWWIYYSKWGKAFKAYDNIVQLHEKDYSCETFKRKYNIDSFIIENAAESNFFTDDIKQSLSVPDKYFINVANYMDVKNQRKILADFLNSDIQDNYELIFIGSIKNAYYNSLVDYYNKSMSKKKVHFLTNVSREDIYTYVKKAAVFVMASKREAFPISITESMAAGVPWISSDVGIVKYLPGGMIFNNEEPLVKLMKKFSENDALRIEKGAEGKKYAMDHFRVDDKVDRLERCIFDAIEKYKKKER